MSGDWYKWEVNPVVWINQVPFHSTLPDPEHHAFFTSPVQEEPKEHWLVRVWEFLVSKWLPEFK